MNHAVNAVRIGLLRGWTTFRILITTADGIGNTVFWNAIPVVFLILNRDASVEGIPLSFAALALPGFLGITVAAAAYGPAYYIAAEREDGTLLRAKAVPHGLFAYVTGVLTMSVLETLVSIVVLLGVGFALFDGIRIPDPLGWLLLAAVTVLALLATMPLGVIIGSVIKSPRLIGGVGLLVIGGMTVVSGIFIPLQAFPGWLQVLAQALPPYWAGMGMRAALLPPEAAAWELTESWRFAEMFGVLGVWAVVGALIAPVVLKRMARRATGSSLEANRQQALQRM